MFVYPTRHSLDIFRFSKAPDKEEDVDVWTSNLDLPTWKRLEGAESLDVTELLARWLGGGTHPLPSYWNGQRFILLEKTPARLSSA